ncbi:hypothetical protein KL86PLE_130096 [uncultured Pleomorphomonas sp.]|uniref:Uncharacterized protein n=1 Tax=uncultured Pleomorphomonas sp. TaxID=442121 RepID=A0A212L9D5_9HYPH|nr:hypothetical protein KL86PLE_130096 [uncultured Pleomorphomonas sp.]
MRGGRGGRPIGISRKCKRPPGEEIRWALQFSVDGMGGGMPLQLTCDAGGGASQDGHSKGGGLLRPNRRCPGRRKGRSVLTKAAKWSREEERTIIA